MGRAKAGRKKKLTKAAKSAKLDSTGNEFKNVTKSIKEQIDQAIEYFKSGDVPEAKNIIKTVLKEIEKKWDSHGEEDSMLLNDCGALLSEIGEEKLAKNALRRSVTISPNSNYEKYITLGQLTSGSESLKYIEAGIEILKKEKNEKRKLSRAYLNIADLFMTDLCMQNNAQNKCKEAIDNAINADSRNAEGYHTMASYFISSSNFENAKKSLKKGLALWVEDHEPVDEPEVEPDEPEVQPEPTEEREPEMKNKLDPEVRMNALRLCVELELWNDAVTIARQLSEENYENCEPRYFLAFSLLRMYQIETGNEKNNLKNDCYDAATDAQRLAEKAWNERKDRTAKEILSQVRDLLEDLGPVESEFEPEVEPEMEENWETDEDEMEQ